MAERPAAGQGPVGDDERAIVEAWLRRSAAAVRECRAWLTDLDAAIGDGDHGINLDRGLTAVVADLDARQDADDPSTLLVASGRRMLAVVGGASGALYGRALIRAGEALAAPADGRPGRLVAFEAAVEAIVGLGRAARGDKTMLDALLPALDALRTAPPDEDAAHALWRAAGAAEAGASATVPLVARKGRASYLGERSAGHLDPGAASSALLVRCLAEAVADARDGDSHDVLRFRERGRS